MHVCCIPAFPAYPNLPTLHFKLFPHPPIFTSFSSVMVMPKRYVEI